jgi:DHA1 family bicyclomycin/chloramphenicol resistance-like MFS transporter
VPDEPPHTPDSGCLERLRAAGDRFLPAWLSGHGTAFATDEKHIQLTLAVYFAGLAIGQLIYGPLADRFGRRGPLLSGVILFTLASFACAFAPSLEWLIGARFVQALGGCAGMVISRAVVSDKCDAVGSAKVYSQLMLVMGWHRSSRRWRVG